MAPITQVSSYMWNVMSLIPGIPIYGELASLALPAVCAAIVNETCSLQLYEPTCNGHTFSTSMSSHAVDSNSAAAAKVSQWVPAVIGAFESLWRR